jgi:DNA-binding LacI/PurR family transcriptional regulator
MIGKAKHPAFNRKRADHIAVWLWPSTNDFIAANVFRGIQMALHDSQYRVVVASAADGDWETAVASEVQFLEQASVDDTCAGILMWPVAEDQISEPIGRCAEQGVPLAFIDRHPPAGTSGDVVAAENMGSTKRAVDHLLSLGHRRIGLVENADTASSVDERRAGFRRALLSSGIDPDSAWVGRFEPQIGESEEEAMKRALRPLQELADRPTALFCINDSLALSAIEALESFGARVPEDFSIVGFDGLLRWVPGGGRLTSCNQDFQRYGELAAELLLARIADDNPRRAFRYVLLDAPLVIKGSTAAPSASATGPLSGQELNG